MKIAVSATGPSLDAPVDPRFGRAQYFLIVDPDTMEFEVLENPNLTAMAGAGIQSAQLIASKGAEVVLSGNYGPNAAQTLSAIGIRMIPGVMGTVREAVERFKRGELQPVDQATVPGHYGMGMGGGMGMSRGSGTGMGRGGGMGMGRGGRRGMGRGGGAWEGMGRGGGGGFGGQTWPSPIASPPPSGVGSQAELEKLKNQAQMLSQQLEEIRRRIEGLEKGKGSGESGKTGE